MLSRLILVTLFCLAASPAYGLPMKCMTCVEQNATHSYTSALREWQINTHNPHKLKEFKRLFAKYGQTFSYTQNDLDEIDADPISVAAHKASQVAEYVLIEDTSLDVADADIGVNLRWKKDELHQYTGHKAVWRTIVAYRVRDCVYIYKGEIQGTLVSPRGNKGIGFDKIFLPDGEDQTLAEAPSDRISARALAVDAFMKNHFDAVVPAIYDWDGPWQGD